MNGCGVDGCRGGWFWVMVSQGVWTRGVVARLSRLPFLDTKRTRILIDIPIGLPDNGPLPRLCDMKARRALGVKRSSSVFAVPCRAAVYAPAQRIQRVNRAHTGRGVSCQMANILPKVRQADRLLQRRPALRARVYESHPEVCFHVLNGNKALTWNKQQALGVEERLGILCRFYPCAREVFDDAMGSFQRKVLARDDILDALVLAVVAAMPGRLPSLPPRPEKDGTGLPMRIVYPRFSNNITER